MKKPGDKGRDETHANDLEAFEEWESGEEGASEPETASGKVPEDDLDIPGFDDFEAPADETTDEKTMPGTKPAPPKRKKAATAAAEAAPEEIEEEVVQEAGLGAAVADLGSDVPIALVAVIGKTTADVEQLLAYHPGQVVDLGRPPSETVDLVANGKLIARGELVEMDGKLGVRILKLVR